MPSLPVRGRILDITKFGRDDPENMTLGEVVTYWMDVNKVIDASGPMTPHDRAFVSEQWMVLIVAVAEKQGVSPGGLAFFLGELAAGQYANDALQDAP